ncbi:MAG: sigma-70 family RNA polymerase sigma factor [Candidatus Melainabacteria bacterium]|nr:sigma-70 family RNA polymerase sigma factor [Candidatus Melainabacteria bacterium]
MSVMKAKLVGQTHGSSPIEETVREYMPLVHQIARKYSRSRPDLYEDLVQVGAIGLLKSIQYYDPDRTRVASLRTVASCYIKGEIRHYLRDHSSLVQVPRKFNEINAHLSQIEESLSRELGHTPTVSELAKRSGYTIKEICDAQSSWDACVHYESFDHLDGEEDREDNRVLSELVPDKKYQDFVLAAEDRELILQALKRLGGKTRQIIEFVFFYDLSQKETAKKLGISEMGVSRAIHSALGKLKDLLTKEIL